MFHVSAVIFFIRGERSLCSEGPPVDPPMIGKTDFVAIFGAKAIYCDVFVMKIKNIQMHFMYKSQHAFQKQIMHIVSIVSAGCFTAFKKNQKVLNGVIFS